MSFTAFWCPFNCPSTAYRCPFTAFQPPFTAFQLPFTAFQGPPTALSPPSNRPLAALPQLSEQLSAAEPDNRIATLNSCLVMVRLKRFAPAVLEACAAAAADGGAPLVVSLEALKLQVFTAFHCLSPPFSVPFHRLSTAFRCPFNRLSAAFQGPFHCIFTAFSPPFEQVLLSHWAIGAARDRLEADGRPPFADAAFVKAKAEQLWARYTR